MGEIQHLDSSKIVDGADWHGYTTFKSLIQGIHVVNATTEQIRRVRAEELTRLFFMCDSFRFEDRGDPWWETVVVMSGIDDLW